MKTWNFSHSEKMELNHKSQ